MKNVILILKATFIAILTLCPNSVKAVTFGPYLGDANETEITVAWQTDIPSTSEIEWAVGEHPESLNHIVADTSEVTHHEIRVTGLSPGTKHTYRVVSRLNDNIVFEDGPNIFRTAAPKNTPYSFVFLAEAHEETSVEDFNDEILNFDPWFQVQAGDNIDNGDNIEEFRRFFTNGDWYSQLPIFNALGNHNYQSYSREFIPTNTDAELSLELFIPHDRYYTFRYGDTQFFVLDSEHYLSKEVKRDEPEWFEQALIEATDGKNDPALMVAIFHIPPFSSCGDPVCRLRKIAENPWVKRELVKRIEKFGVHLVLVGHDKITEHTIRNGVHYIQVTSGESPRELGSINIGSLFADATNRSIMRAEVDGCNLDFELVNPDGTILHAGQVTGYCNIEK